MNFIQSIQHIQSLHPAYRLGHSGLDGYCDCIGLIIGALSLMGILWPGIHGSNWAARHAVTRLSPLRSAADLSPGDLVFKAREPGSAGYALPSRYDKDPDRRDYYHVGVVTRTRPLTITHMTTPSVTEDHRIGKWSFFAPLHLLPQEEKNPVNETCTAVVTSQDGNPVKVRTAPNQNKPYKVRLEPGTRVTVTEKGPEWCAISVEGLSGYMMTPFLRFEEAPDTVTLTLPRDLAKQLLTLLTQVLSEPSEKR